MRGKDVSPLPWAGLPLTYDGGEAASRFVPSHQFVEFRVVKLQALQECHVSSLPFSVEDVKQAAWQRKLMNMTTVLSSHISPKMIFFFVFW